MLCERILTRAEQLRELSMNPMSLSLTETSVCRQRRCREPVAGLCCSAPRPCGQQDQGAAGV